MARENSERIAEAIREGGRRSGMSIRELARVSRISAAQINRLRAGQSKPSRDTLVALARALGRNPNLLFAAGGAINLDETRELLSWVFGADAEHVEAWKHAGRDVAAVRAIIADPSTGADELAEIALEVFLDQESQENLWHDPMLGSSIEGDDARVLRTLLEQWAYLTSERKSRVIDYVRDQANLSRREEADEMRREDPNYGKP